MATKITSPAVCDCTESLKYYQDITFILGGLCAIMALGMCCLFLVVRRQVAHLLKIHELGNIPFEVRTDTEGNLLADKAEVVSLRQQSRDSLVRIIKFQLDQYLRQANADYDVEEMDYNYDYSRKPIRGARDLFKYRDHSVTDAEEDGPPTARNPMDSDMRRTFRRHYDLNLLAKMMEEQQTIPHVDLNLADHQQLQFLLC